jgi:hypothetical protein
MNENEAVVAEPTDEVVEETPAVEPTEDSQGTEVDTAAPAVAAPNNTEFADVQEWQQHNREREAYETEEKSRILGAAKDKGVFTDEQIAALEEDGLSIDDARAIEFTMGVAENDKLMEAVKNQDAQGVADALIEDEISRGSTPEEAQQKYDKMRKNLVNGGFAIAQSVLKRILDVRVPEIIDFILSDVKAHSSLSSRETGTGSEKIGQDEFIGSLKNPKEFSKALLRAYVRDDGLAEQSVRLYGEPAQALQKAADTGDVKSLAIALEAFNNLINQDAEKENHWTAFSQVVAAELKPGKKSVALDGSVRELMKKMFDGGDKYTTYIGSKDDWQKPASGDDKK